MSIFFFFALIVWIKFETRFQESGLNFKVGPRCSFYVYLFIYSKKQYEVWTEFYLNSISDHLFIYYHTPNSLLLLLPPAISSKSLLLLLQELPTKSASFDRSNSYPYLALFSHLYCKFLFLFELLNFIEKLKHTNNKVHYSYYRDDYDVD
jgi:hypothetical protein